MKLQRHFQKECVEFISNGEFVEMYINPPEIIKMQEIGECH